MTSEATLIKQVIQIHNATGDATSELEWKLDRAQIALDSWQRVINNANHRNGAKQVRQWEKTFVRQQQRVLHLTDLLHTARAIICEDCGNVIDDENHYDWFGAADFGGNQLPCVSGDAYLPF